MPWLVQSGTFLQCSEPDAAWRQGRGSTIRDFSLIPKQIPIFFLSLLGTFDLCLNQPWTEPNPALVWRLSS